jgi:hypothetical protein
MLISTAWNYLKKNNIFVWITLSGFVVDYYKKFSWKESDLIHAYMSK